jgi:YD repeat-containing protein
MECKNIYFRAGNRRAFTLVELMVAAALSLMVATVIVMLALFSSRSFVAMTHYTEMGQLSRLALDKMSMEIRQARQLTAYSSQSLTLTDASGNPLQFTYDPTRRILERVRGGTASTYLTDCDALQFSIYQHTMKSNTFDCYSPVDLPSARVIEVSWSCSRPILGLKATTDSMQSTKVTLRNN